MFKGILLLVLVVTLGSASTFCYAQNFAFAVDKPADLRQLVDRTKAEGADYEMVIYIYLMANYEEVAPGRVVSLDKLPNGEVSLEVFQHDFKTADGGVISYTRRTADMSRVSELVSFPNGDMGAVRDWVELIYKSVDFGGPANVWKGAEQLEYAPEDVGVAGCYYYIREVKSDRLEVKASCGC